jgi:hypothetical protein
MTHVQGLHFTIPHCVSVGGSDGHLHQRWIYKPNGELDTLGGLVVACLLFSPRFAGSSPAEDDGFLRKVKFHSMTSFRGEVKPSVLCRKILWRDEEPEYKRDTF